MTNETAARAGRLTCWILCAAALILSFTAPAPAAAQVSPPVAEVLSFLMTNRAVDTGDTTRDEAAAEGARDALSRALLVSLSTLPITSSSGGFVYRFNPALGTAERASSSFAPLFVDKALPAGQGSASFGIAVQFSRFTSLDGGDLRDGTLVTTANRFVDETEAFDVETLTLRLRALTTTAWVSYGVTDRIEIAAALPVVALSLEGERVDRYRGERFLQAQAEVQRVGIGDALVRGKALLAPGRGGGIAVGADLRLPTGREEDLTGAGKAALRVFVAASTEQGITSAHVQAGWGKGGVSDQLDYGAALAVAVTPRLTLAGEVLGRRLYDLGRLGLVTATHPQVAGAETSRLAPLGESSHVARVAGGVKWNVSKSWLLSGSLTLPLTEAGLTGFSPAVALEYAFDR